jgi:CheY-like chemotaxis protein
MKTILQVEDDSNDVFFFQRAMKKAGVANPIQVASDGRQAIDYLKGADKFADREKFPLPDLVLLDMKLPYVMGLDVLNWIRRESGLPLVVVMLTASTSDADVTAAYRLGANGFLVKPSDADKFQDMIVALHLFWLRHNIMPQSSSPGEAPAHFSRIDPGAEHLAGPIDVPVEWQSVISEPTQQTVQPVGL